MTRYILITAAALAVSVCLMPAPTQAASHTGNAHRYQGGPKTETPHVMKRPDKAARDAESDGGHHYSGGPKSEPHHMGKKR